MNKPAHATLSLGETRRQYLFAPDFPPMPVGHSKDAHTRKDSGRSLQTPTHK